MTHGFNIYGDSRLMKFSLLVAMVGLTLIFGTTTVMASDPTLRLQISPRECTVDTLTTGVSQATTLNPSDCQRMLNEQQSADAQAAMQEQQAIVGHLAVSASTHNASQKSFEDALFEPLASWLGIGSKNASPVTPVVTSVTLAGAAGIMVDAALFELRFTKFVRTLTRRGIRAAIVGLQRSVFRK